MDSSSKKREFAPVTLVLADCFPFYSCFVPSFSAKSAELVSYNL